MTAVSDSVFSFPPANFAFLSPTGRNNINNNGYIYAFLSTTYLAVQCLLQPTMLIFTLD